LRKVQIHGPFPAALPVAPLQHPLIQGKVHADTRGIVVLVTVGTGNHPGQADGIEAGDGSMDPACCPECVFQGIHQGGGIFIVVCIFRQQYTADIAPLVSLGDMVAGAAVAEAQDFSIFLQNKGVIRRKIRMFQENLVKISRIQSILIGCVVSGFLVFGQSFLQLWVGDGYSASFWVAALLMLPGSIDLIQVLGIEIQRAQNLHRFRGIVYIIMAIINCFISIPLCMYWGAIGSAFGTCLSLIIVQGLIINIYLHKRCHINIVHFWKSILHIVLGILPPFILGLVATHFAETSSWMTLIAGILIYCMIYAGSMWFIALNHEEKNMLLSLFRKRRVHKNKS
jgi:hypothetical protein